MTYKTYTEDLADFGYREQEEAKNLFEEAYDHFSSNHPHWSEEKICYWAERNAKRRFEEMST